MNLVLFFTRGNSLQTWDRIGTLSREVALYQELVARGVNVTFITYGDAGDLTYRQQLPGIEVRCNRWRLPLFLYEWLIPWLHAAPLRQADILKSNQAKGAHIAWLSARLWRKPLIVRSGYLWSQNYTQEKGRYAWMAIVASFLESWEYRHADQVVVTTYDLRKQILSRFPRLASKIAVIPNYVDTRLFAPKEAQKDFDLVYVGRLSKEKNLPLLLEAVEGTPLRLAIVGQGSQEQALKGQFAHLQNQASWLGRVPNADLPAILNRACLFILPSQYEGNPKALIEAMACGLPVIGTDVPGIRELIAQGQTGWLCPPTVDGIRSAVQHLISQPELRETLGANARAYAIQHFSLDRVIEQELALYSRLSRGSW